MKSLLACPFAVATGFVLSLSAVRAQYASSVINYTPGTGVSVGYDNPSAALGDPSRVTPGDFGGPVTPFAPPYLNSQVVSVGTGGSLTVQFDQPINNHAGNPYGLDFMVFGNSGFIITNPLDENFEPIGTPVTDGSLFGSGATTSVAVSADGTTFFTLSLDLSSAIDTMFPTDGQGDFGLPVDPSLKGSDFAGLSLEGIRELYAGSGGGTGFDLDWARDAAGAPVTLTDIRFVRVEVTGGKAEIDGFSGVTAVPEPGTWALLALGLGMGGPLVRRLRRSSPATPLR